MNLQAMLQFFYLSLLMGLSLMSYFIKINFYMQKKIKLI